jgi:hypothetical protein
MDGWMDGLFEYSIIGIPKPSNTWLGGCIDETVNESMDGSMNYYITGSMDESMDV